jgi:hypothetical protein
MYKFVAGSSALLFVFLITGCGSDSSKPVQPDGLYRVPINRTPPVPASSISLAPTESFVEGYRS